MHKFFAKTQFLGKKVIFLPECHSTNDYALDLLKNESQIEGTTVITANQTQGKGQRGNTWESEPEKNITFSFILRPGMIPPNLQFQLHIITTLSIYNLLFPTLGQKLKIKWPNDIMYADKKLGGILVENTLKGQNIEYSVVGIGLNLNQLRFVNEKATSLSEISGEVYEVNDLIEKLLIQFEKTYLSLKNGNIKSLTAQYIRRLYLLNKPHSYETGGRIFRGTIVGIGPTGLLQIQEADQVHKFAFKEVNYS